MHEPSDGVAEEVERQLQLTLAAAAIAARHAIARATARDRAGTDATASRPPEPRRPGSTPSGCSRPRTCAPCSIPTGGRPPRRRTIADMWQEANTWRDPDRPPARPRRSSTTPRDRIRQEVRDRTGLDPTQILTLAAVQELEHEHQATLTEQPTQPAELAADRQRGVRRAASTIRSAASSSARVSSPPACPSPAIEARTLADLGQAREAAEAARTPPSDLGGAAPRRAALARRASSRADGERRAADTAATAASPRSFRQPRGVACAAQSRATRTERD